MSILIKNGQVFDVNKGFFVEKDILVSDSKIKSLEKGIGTSEGTTIINAENKKIFPGFIDAHSHIGMWTYTQNGNDANECVHPITPLMRAIDGANPQDKCFIEAVKAGFTTVMITPGSGNALGGQAAVIKTCGRTISEMTVNPYAALKIAFGENPKNVYGSIGKSPSSRMSTYSILEEEFEKALLYKEKVLKDENLRDFYWDTYLPVLNKQIPIKIHAHRADDIMSGIRLAEKFNLKFTLDHCTEGHLIVDELLSRNAPIMTGPPLLFKSKQELKNATINTSKILIEAGCLVSLTSDHPFSNISYLTTAAGLMVKKGLPYSEAIKMITLNPAKAIGMEKNIGSIVEGKDADIVILDGDPLEIRTNIETTIIKGKIIYNNCKKK